MKSTLTLLTALVLCLAVALPPAAASAAAAVATAAPTTTTACDTVPFRDRTGDFITGGNPNAIDLRDPAAVTRDVEYDPATNRYIVTERIGDDYFRSPTYLTFDEYAAYRERQQQSAYFDRLQGVRSSDGVGLNGLEDPIEAVDVSKSLVDRLFGGSDVNIDTRGNIDLTFGVDVRTVKNPAYTIRQQRQGGFDFKMNINMNVTGSIGSKLQLTSSYNNNANFNFDRQLIKVTYNAAEFGEDQILQNIEMGNVSLPLRSSLIQGSQGLLGVRADLKFGRLGLTFLASQQKTKRDEIEIKGGAQFQEFEVRADEYDENRHFFLSHFNRDNFESALDNLPNIVTNFKLNRIEVWITNDRDQTEGVREIAALADLGESLRLTALDESELRRGNGSSFRGELLPDNDANSLYDDLVADPELRKKQNVTDRLQRAPFDLRQSIDFERVRARLLSPQEFTYHPDLGFVSINVNVRPDQVLSAAYEYTYNGRVYKVGEFSNDLPVVTSGRRGNTGPGNPPGQDSAQGDFTVLFTRLLKSTVPRVDVPAWDLMMKNFYNIGAYQVNREDFRLDITYEDPGEGQKRFLPTSSIAGVPLVRVFGLDELNVQLDPQRDGIFDFVPGLTIYPRNGRIMFPVLEPFGKTLRENFDGPDSLAAQQRYVYDILYDSTVVRAREYPEFNRFIIRGSYKSTVSNEISLGAFNVPRGSVRVSAGGQILREGQDYEINYGIGKITILNDAYINSGVPVRVSFEDNAVFGLQNRSMLGIRADYEFSRKLSLGATYLHLFERPFTQKVNVGDDPINNRIYGLDLVYGDDAPWLTRFVDKIPGLSTKEPSSINFTAETALLKPGHSKAIDIKKGEGGTVYVDDFEGSASGYDLKTPLNAWALASVPQNNPLFPEGALSNDLALNANRALFNWYRIDRVGRGSDGDSPYSVQINPQDLYPLRQVNSFQNNALFTFDLTFSPKERGPYNYELPDGYPGISRGLDGTGQLQEPRSRWGGIMRDLQTNDFQAANIEYLEFWVMSPFLDGRSNADHEGDLYIEFGNVSEDIMRDGRLFFEQGLPTADGANANRPVDITAYGRVPRSAPIAPGFDTDEDARAQQDLGFDGLDDDGEREFFADYLNAVSARYPNLSDRWREDPSADNFVSFQDQPDNLTTQERYADFNGPQGNSPTPTGGQLAIGFSNLPDTEDINDDNTLNENESYFQYKIPFRLDPMAADGPGSIDIEAARYVTQTTIVEPTANSNRPRMIWYRFKVPLDQFDARVGAIQDFRSIRFMRMYLKGFEEDVTFRFARLDLVRNQWRRYLRNRALLPPGPTPVPADVDVYFDVDAINIEENSGREPFPYTLPTGIQRERQLNTINNIQQNEQSQVITVCDLPDGQARAIYKILNLDMRVFERLRMFIHAEEFDLEGGLIAPEVLDDGDLRLFMRLGSDFQDNYYEYELPLSFTRSEDVMSLAPNSPELSEAIWPEVNNLEIVLQDLIQLKTDRNASGQRLQDPYTTPVPDDPDKTLTIIGNPNLGLVKGIMIGVRNARGGAQQVCAQVWVNELRLNGLDEQGGAAGLARLDLQLADFGSVSASGSFSTIGWGSLEQKLADRARESSLVYDLAGSFEMGKFLPEQSGVRVPMTVVYSNNVRQPEYDPYDLDIKLADKLADAPADQVDSLREQAVDRIVQREINFTNVRKERTASGKPMPYDISNFSVSYVYNETDRTSPLIELDEVVNHYAALDYTYSLPAKPIEPFKKLKLSDKYFKLIKGVNFNPVPSRFAFSTVMDRTLQSTRYRFAGPDPELNTFFNRNWTWDRDYNLNWDFSKGLRFQFNAVNRAVIDELPTFTEDGDLISDQERKDLVWNNVRDFGRNKAYQHRFDVNYTLPTKQIPYLDFLNVTAQYSGSYNWNAAALNLDSLGNIISNGNQRQLRGDLNFETLYRQFKYLQKIENGNRATRGRGRGRGAGRQGSLGDPRDQSRGGAGDLPGRGRTDRDVVDKDRVAAQRDQVAGKDGDGADGNDPADGKGRRGKRGKAKKNDKKRKGEKREREVTKAERIALRPLMLLRRGNVTYNEEFGTTLPGFRPNAQYLGLADGFGAPGWDFVGGLQPDIRGTDVRDQSTYLYRNVEWFSDAITLNQQVYQTYSKNLAAQLSVEPFKDFRVDFDISQRFTENHSEFFKDTLVGPGQSFQRLVPADVGSYTISYGALNTLFGADPEDLFRTFEANRVIVSQRLSGSNAPHADDDLAALGYREGFGPNQQNVQLAAFLAAYTDDDPNTVSLDIFKTRPKVNWRLTYNGLSRVKGFDKMFASFSLTHSYKSSLTINSFNTNLLFDGPNTINPATQSFYSRLVIPDLVISEQFSPLIGVDARLKNEMSLRFSLNRSRSLGMSFVDNQLAERNSEEWSIGYGYVVKNVDLLQYFGGKKRKRRSRRQRPDDANDDDDDQNAQQRQTGNSRANPQRQQPGGGRNNGVGNDLDLQLDVRFANDETRNRYLDQQGVSDPTRGAQSLSISPSAEYEINRQLSLRVFVDYRRQIPKTTNSFPTTNTQAGVTVRFKLN